MNSQTPTMTGVITRSSLVIATEHVLFTAPRQFTSDRLWHLSIFRGLFHPSRDLLIAAPSRYHAECIADQVVTGDEWFPCFSAEPVDTAEILGLSTSGGASR